MYYFYRVPPCLFVGLREKDKIVGFIWREFPQAHGPECKRAFLINSSVFVVYFLRLMSLISSVCVSQRKQRMQSLCEFPWAWVTSRKALSKYNNSQLLISYRTGVWIGWRLAPDPDSVAFEFLLLKRGDGVPPQIASIWSFALHIQCSCGWW